MVDISNKIIKAGIGISVISIILYMVSNRGWDSGNWITIGDNWMALFGWIFFTSMAFIYFLAKDIGMLKSVLGGSMIGLGFSTILGYMYDNNILFDTVIDGDILLWEVQFFIMVLWVFIGIIKGSVSQ